MATVAFQFESPHGEALGTFRMDISQAMELAGEKVLNAAEGLIRQPDEASSLERILSTANAFGNLVLSNLVLLERDLNSQISSIEQIPEGSRLTLTGDWMTHRLPWEAAAIGTTWLGVRFALKRVVTDRSARNPKELPISGLRANDPRDLTVFLGQGPGLVGTVSECNIAENWMRIVRRTAGLKGQVHTLVTSEPSRESLLQALSNSTILHYSGHGVIDPVTKQRAFAPVDSEAEGLVTSEDLQHIKTVPNYIYLNGCGLASHTSLPEYSGNELPVALIRSGARWVVGPTVRFMTYRYFELLRAYYRCLDALSWGPAEAMRQARMHLANTPMLRREFPLALYTVVYGPAKDWSLVATNSETNSNTPSPTLSTRPMAYPIHCSSCQTTIQSKFGNYATNPSDPPLCRSCSLGATADPTATASSAEKQYKNASHATDIPSEDYQESQTSLNFRRKLGDDAVQFTKYYCLDRRMEIPCELRRSIPQPLQMDPNRPYLRAKPDPSNWTECMEVANTEARLRRESLAFIRIRFVDRSQMPPLGSTELIRLLTELDQAADQDRGKPCEIHRFHIVVSSEGFSEDAWDFIRSPGIQWRDDHRSLLIHDSKNNRIGFAPVDRHAHSLQKFFQPHSLDEQFTHVMDWLGEQVPLRESLSLRSIVRRTGFDQDTVDTAMRIFANKHNLSVLESKEFGLCIEDSLISKHDPSN